ncbi:MAG: type II toxin-antitoxin system VapC family toxin [Anaeromyxobacteraceae bacterium]
MILVDTSVWVEHLRAGSPRLRRLLEEGEVLVHPHVIGELACGSLARRAEVLGLLRALPGATMASEQEAHRLVDAHGLHGRGIGWIDVHLVASALLSGAGLWTLDRRLEREAARVGVMRG